MFFRLVFTLAAITAILALESRFQRPLEQSHFPTYYTLLFACFVNLVYLVAARLGASPRVMAVIQLSVDVLIVSGLVYLTGVERIFAYLYFASVIAASLLISPRAGFFFASLATVLLAGVLITYFVTHQQGVRPPFSDPQVWGDYEPRRPFLLAYLFFFALSLHLVAFLASLLAGEVSRVRILNEEILHNMAGGVLAVDRYGGLAFVNEQAAKLLGISGRERAIGRPFSEVLPGPVAATVENALRGGTRVEREVALGDTPLQVVVSYLPDGPGRVRGVIAILNDLTLRREIEQLAQRQERFKGIFEMSAGMAHEVRNPLASIRGAAQELESTPGGNEDDRKLLQVIMRESDRLDKIITDFLEYATEKPLDLELCDLSEILQHTATLLESREGSKKVGVFRDWPEKILARGDSDRLKQVFLNLGINAMEACMDRGGGQVHIAATVSTAGPKPAVIVEIRDTGPGIEADVLARMFTPFFSTKPRGTGMGLAIARKIVNAHGGDIRVDSEVGKGTRVRVALPQP